VVQAQRGRKLFGALLVALAVAAIGAAGALAASLNFFEPASSPEPVGGIPRSVAIADLNGAGGPDLAVANSDSDTVSILINNGNANFHPQAGGPVAAGDVPWFVTAADLDGDGDQDLAVVNTNAGEVTILINNGHGKFHQSNSSPVTVGTEPESLVAADLDGDHDIDLAVANAVADTVTILLNNGDARFHEPGSSPELVGGEPTSIAAADFDGDNDQDLAVADFVGEVTILLNNGSGNFMRPASSPETAGAGPNSIVAANLDGGGGPDLAVANLDSSDVTILDNAGGGDFVEPATSPVAAGDSPYAITASDFEGDGDQDLAVADDTVPGQVTILGNNGSGKFHQPGSSPYTVGANAQSVAAADLDTRPGQDLAVVNAGSDNVTILKNR
jgi:hypothetical protein